MRQQSPEALKKPSQLLIYGYRSSRPIVIETDAKGNKKAFEQQFDPSRAPKVESYDPDNPPLIAEKPLPYQAALDRLGLRSASPVEPISSPEPVTPLLDTLKPSRTSRPTRLQIVERAS